MGFRGRASGELFSKIMDFGVMVQTHRKNCFEDRTRLGERPAGPYKALIYNILAREGQTWDACSRPGPPHPAAATEKVVRPPESGGAEKFASVSRRARVAFEANLAISAPISAPALPRIARLGIARLGIVRLAGRLPAASILHSSTASCSARRVRSLREALHSRGCCGLSFCRAGSGSRQHETSSRPPPRKP